MAKQSGLGQESVPFLAALSEHLEGGLTADLTCDCYAQHMASCANSTHVEGRNQAAPK